MAQWSMKCKAGINRHEQYSAGLTEQRQAGQHSEGWTGLCRAELSQAVKRQYLGKESKANQ